MTLHYFSEKRLTETTLLRNQIIGRHPIMNVTSLHPTENEAVYQKRVVLFIPQSARRQSLPRLRETMYRYLLYFPSLQKNHRRKKMRHAYKKRNTLGIIRMQHLQRTARIQNSIMRNQPAKPIGHVQMETMKKRIFLTKVRVMRVQYWR